MRYALGGLAGSSLLFALEPALLGGWSSLAVATASVAAAFIMFVGPLAGAHRLLVTEQSALLAKNAQRLREALDRLHDAADGEDLTHASNLEHLLAGLQEERRIVETMRTWPWRPETFRVLLTALLLPVLIWLIQFLLTRLLT